MEKVLKFWFMQVSRGYSLPMSITNWLVVFSLGILGDGNIFYGVLALIGFMFAHLGTNVFDDVVDQWLKVPKQKYKSVHLDNGQTNLKAISVLAFVYFSIAAVIGLFLTIKCGYVVAILAAIGAVIALLYPRLNNYSLGELAVGLVFGPLLFFGVYYVMTGLIVPKVLYVSVPVAIFTVVVLMVHALMDYDFDIKSGKRTLCILAGSKLLALNLIFALIIIAYFITLLLILYDYLPILAGASFGAIVAIVTLYARLARYIGTDVHAQDEFIKNFALARNIGTVYCFAVAAALLIEKFIIWKVL